MLGEWYLDNPGDEFWIFLEKKKDPKNSNWMPVEIVGVVRMQFWMPMEIVGESRILLEIVY